MAQQEGGWPLGLQPLNVRVGLVRGRNFSGSTSFNTILSGSPSSSTDSSSDLDTESTGSFFHDRSTTLGSLIGVPRIVNLSRRSIRGTSNSEAINGAHKNYRSRTWCFSLCPTDTTDAETTTRDPPSLGHFLAVERRAAADEHQRRSHSSVFCGPDELAIACDREPNSLFVNGQIAPPAHESSSSPLSGSDVHRRNTNGLGQGSGQGFPVLQFPCICG